MEKQLNKKRVAVMATDGFEQSEFEEPIKALKKEGISVDIISLNKGKIKGWKEKKWGERTWEISIYNVYNRMNPYFYYLGYEYRNNKSYGVIKQVTLFPFVPSFSYNIKF